MEWAWPQWVYAGLFVSNIVLCVSKHGESRGPYDGPLATFCAAVSIWILYEGGFWTPVQ